MTLQSHESAQLAVADTHAWADPAFVLAVESCMREAVARREGAVVAAALEAIVAGGKRLRPLLVLAARGDGEHDPDTVWASDAPLVLAASAIELVHTASLIHDDILDAADVRRGAPTVAARHGFDVAVAAGDLLFSVAFELLAQLEPGVGERIALRAVGILAAAARRLAEGEALQAGQRTLDTSATAYELRCAKKTGALFAAALQIGALITGTDDEDADSLAILERFGLDVGVAFQIVDDVLDCQADSATLGKEPGADLRSGTVTLPILIAACEDTQIAPRFPAHDEASVAETLKRIAESGALNACSARAWELHDRAIELVETLPERFSQRALCAVADQSVARLS